MNKIEKQITKLNTVNNIIENVFKSTYYYYGHINENGVYEADEGMEEQWNLFLETVSEIEEMIEKHYCK